MNLPNKLTVLRIILVPIMILVPILNLQGEVLGISLNWIIADSIFIIAAITDKLDGNIARSRNQITTFGKFLDPIADKILVLTAMIMLVEDGRLYAWIPIIVLFREFIVSGYRLIAVENGGKVIAASIWGKLKTATQMVALIIALVDVNPYWSCFTGNIKAEAISYNVAFGINLVATILMTISIIATIFSGYDYIKNGKNLFKESK